MPLVQEFTVPLVSNPLLRFKIILFNKYDLPVLYIPATPTMTMGFEILFRISRASGFTES